MVGLFTGLWWGLTKITYIAVTMLIISQLLEPDFPSPAILLPKILKIRCMKDTRCTGEIHPWAESQKMSDFVIKLEYSKEMGIRGWCLQRLCFLPSEECTCVWIAVLGHSLHSIATVYCIAPWLDALPLRKGPASTSLALKCPGLSTGLGSKKVPNKDMLSEMTGWLDERMN